MVGLDQLALVHVPDLRCVLRVVCHQVTLVFEHVIVAYPRQALQLVVSLLQVGSIVFLFTRCLHAPLCQVKALERAIAGRGEPQLHVLLVKAETGDGASKVAVGLFAGSILKYPRPPSNTSISIISPVV